MPTAEEVLWLARRSEGTGFDQLGKFDPADAEGPSEGFVSDALELGGDLLGGIFDLLDRPGRAGRYLFYKQDVGQAVSAFLPAFVAEGVGLEASRPLFTADVVGEEPGFTPGYLGSLFADIITDPLTLGLGGVVSKLGRAGLRAAGVKSFQVLDKARKAGGIRGGLSEAALGAGGLFSKRLQLRAGGLSSPEADLYLGLQRTMRGERNATLAVGAAEHA